MNLNRIQLVGRLGTDPVIHFTPSGKSVAEINLAVKRTWIRDGERESETTWLTVSFWERSAKSLKEHARKGSELFVEGWLKLDSWEDRNTGKQQQKLCIVGERWQFVGSRPRGQMASEQKQAKDNAQPAAFHQPVATSTNTEDQIPF